MNGMNLFSLEIVRKTWDLQFFIFTYYTREPTKLMEDQYIIVSKAEIFTTVLLMS